MKWRAYVLVSCMLTLQSSTTLCRDAFKGSAWDESISIDLVDADIRKVLGFFAEIVGVNMDVSSCVSGTVTVRLTDVPARIAFQLIVENGGYAFKEDGPDFVEVYCPGEKPDMGEMLPISRDPVKFDMDVTIRVEVEGEDGHRRELIRKTLKMPNPPLLKVIEGDSVIKFHISTAVLELDSYKTQITLKASWPLEDPGFITEVRGSKTLDLPPGSDEILLAEFPFTDGRRLLVFIEPGFRNWGQTERAKPKH